MRTVLGEVESTKAISLSKATAVMSTFAASENGASQATAAYLRRSLASFKELKSLYKDLLKATSTSSHKRKRHSSLVVGDTDDSHSTRKRLRPQ